jgi:hypothetical protein
MVHSGVMWPTLANSNSLSWKTYYFPSQEHESLVANEALVLVKGILTLCEAPYFAGPSVVWIKTLRSHTLQSVVVPCNAKATKRRSLLTSWTILFRTFEEWKSEAGVTWQRHTQATQLVTGSRVEDPSQLCLHVHVDPPTAAPFPSLESKTRVQLNTFASFGDIVVVFTVEESWSQNLARIL